MNTETKQKWVEALRSGKYKQCHDAYHKDGKFCVLGVLLDVINPSIWMQAKSFTSTLDALLPSHRQLQLIKLNGLIHKEGREIAKPMSFQDLATWIERNKYL